MIATFLTLIFSSALFNKSYFKNCNLSSSDLSSHIVTYSIFVNHIFDFNGLFYVILAIATLEINLNKNGECE